MTTTDVREEVRERYAEAAPKLEQGCGCGCDCESIGCCGEEETTLFGKGSTRQASEGSFPRTRGEREPRLRKPGRRRRSCHEGETVLDLGSGGGIDVLLSAGGSALPGPSTGST